MEKKKKKSETRSTENSIIRIPDQILKLFAFKDSLKSENEEDKYIESVIAELAKDFVKQDGMLGENILSKFICIHSFKEAEAQKFLLNCIILVNLKFLLENGTNNSVIGNTLYVDFKNQFSPQFINRVVEGLLSNNKKEFSELLLKSFNFIKVSKDSGISGLLLQNKLEELICGGKIKYLIFDSMQSLEDLGLNEVNGKKRGFDHNSFFENLYVKAKENSVTVIFIRSLTLISKYENGKDIRNFKKGYIISSIDDLISDHILIERICNFKSVQKQVSKEKQSYVFKPIQSNVFGEILYFFDRENIVFQNE